MKKQAKFPYPLNEADIIKILKLYKKSIRKERQEANLAHKHRNKNPKVLANNIHKSGPKNTI